MLMTLVFSGARSLRIITRSGYCIIPFHGGELWAISSNAGRVMFLNAGDGYIRKRLYTSVKSIQEAILICGCAVSIFLLKKRTRLNWYILLDYSYLQVGFLY